MFKVKRGVLILLLILGIVCLIGIRCSDACCGMGVAILEFTNEPDPFNACLEECTVFSGIVYDYYWDMGFIDLFPVEVTISIYNMDGDLINTIYAEVTKTGGGPGDPEGRFSDPGFDEGEYGYWEFTANWCGTDLLGNIVPSGTYSYTITSSASGMGSDTGYGQVEVEGEPCCEEGAAIMIAPDTFNKCRHAMWITVYAMLPVGFDVQDICTAYIVSVDGSPLLVPIEADAVLDVEALDGEVVRVVKFKSDDVGAMLPVKDEVEICMEVVLCDETGEPFVTFCPACDTIKVIEQCSG